MRPRFIVPDDALTIDEAIGVEPTPWRTKVLIAALTLLVAAVALCIDRARSGDLYLQLFSGRFIVEHGLVSHDPFPTIGQGRQWLNQQWLSELGFYSAARSVGITGITVLYALLIAAPLALVLAAIRRKGPVMMIAAAVLYFPGLLAIIHPRAAGFTLLAFSVLLVMILAAWRLAARPGEKPKGLRWALVAIPLLFALWANLHGGFVAGLLLIALATIGLAIDRWRGLPGQVAQHRVALLGLAGVLAAVAATFATPLGGAIWTYILSFRNPALSLASTEWEPVTQSPPAIAYLAVAAVFSGWLWWRSPKPRRVMPVLVVAGFLVFAATSMRNIVFVAPALVLQIACSTPDRQVPAPRAILGLALAGIVGAVLTYAAILGPADNDGVGSPAVQYALNHPPKHGRIAAYAGPSSYILWRSPRTRVVIDGWLEHFTPGELRGNFGILHGSDRNLTRDVRRLHVGAVIAHLPPAIQSLEAHGFVAEYSGPDGTYLVRKRFAQGSA